MSARFGHVYNKNLTAWRERLSKEVAEKKEHGDLVAYERQQG